MTNTVASKEQTKKPRLKFIDMARSFAILLMLEGHFTGAALGNKYRDNEIWLYKFWHNLHGFTSPLFFTVTGLVFVYLLSGQNQIPYFQNLRVKKGYKRVLELLFWGYLIQFNLWSLAKSIYYGSALRQDWFYAFHVLQSIGVGILILLLIYGVFKIIQYGKLYWYYLFFALVIFLFYSWLKNYIQMDKAFVAENPTSSYSYWPHNAHPIIQNMFYGRFSDFSFVRYSGYVVLGGMLGSLVRTFEVHTKKLWFGLLFIVAGILLNLFIQPCFYMADKWIVDLGIAEKSVYILNSTSFVRFGQVVSFLGLLMLIDKYFTIKEGLFLKIGQNTLPIYVVHVIILYGGIFGFGVTPYLVNQDQHPWVAAGLSFSFIVIFAIMIKYIVPLNDFYNRFLQIISFGKLGHK